MAKFKVGDRVVVVKNNPFSGLDESHFIGETGEVVEIYSRLMFQSCSIITLLKAYGVVLSQEQSQSTVGSM